MFNAKQAGEYYTKVSLKVLLSWGIVFGVSLLIAISGYFLNVWPGRPPGFVIQAAILGTLPAFLMLFGAFELAARFVRAMYSLSLKDAHNFIWMQLFGRPGFRPFLRVAEGQIAFGDDVLKKAGGPGGLVVYNDSAVVLERAGKLTRVVRGPAFPKLAPFEKIWDTVDLLPHHWVFPVSAVTLDGIPITYEASIKFRIGDTEEDVFKAATCKWVRDAWRTEPDRLMIWTKRVIISATEGSLRAILARYELDQLLETAVRERIREQLNIALKNSAGSMGVVIDEVQLDNIAFKDQILDQWFSAWQAERDREVQEALTDAKARRIEIEERARIEVREHMMRRTIQAMQQLKQEGHENSAHFVILGFIEMIRNTDNRLYMPDQMLNTFDALRQRFASCSSENPATPEQKPPQ